MAPAANRFILLCLISAALHAFSTISSAQAADPPAQPPAQPPAAKPAEKPAATTLSLLLLDTGNSSATDDILGSPMRRFADVVVPKTLGKGARHEVHVSNTHESAVKLLKEGKIGAAVVTPAFYLAHKTDLKLAAIAELSSTTTNGESYRLIAPRTTAKLADLVGKRVGAVNAAEKDYLDAVVLESAVSLEWTQTADLSAALDAIISAKPDALAGLLINRQISALLDADPKLAAKVATLHTSGTLSGPLLVTVGEVLTNAQSALLESAVFALKDDDNGRKLLEGCGWGGVHELNDARLTAAAKLIELAAIKRKQEAEKKAAEAPSKEKPADPPAKEKPATN